MSELDITYEPRKAIKGQALADFLVEFADFPEEAGKLPAGKPWVLFIDGSACRAGVGLGVHLASPDGQEYFYAATLTFKATNNEVEYEALVVGLGMDAEMGVTEVEVRSDSQVVVNQMMGIYATKGEKLTKYLEHVWQLRDKFSFFNITQVQRSDNEVADKLARMASGLKEAPLLWPVTRRVIEITAVGIIIGVLSPAIPAWASRMAKYLETGELPEAKDEAKRLKRRAARFLLIDGIFYKKGFSTPLLRCISKEEAEYILAEIHEGMCRNHSGGKALARKALRAGYYWPNALRDSVEFAKKCTKC